MDNLHHPFQRAHIHVRERDGVEVYFSLATVEGVLGDVLLGGYE